MSASLKILFSKIAVIPISILKAPQSKTSNTSIKQMAKSSLKMTTVARKSIPAHKFHLKSPR